MMALIQEYRWRSTSHWTKIVIGVYLASFAYLFAENFVFSSTLDVLSFREVDDSAFHAYLRKAHESFHPLGLNGYAYGWFFWFPLFVLTYPLYFLSVYAGIDWPLIVFPRQLSLLFVMGTGYMVYKIASLYSKDAFSKAMVALFFLLTPAAGYYALRFGTVGQTMFLCALTFYLAARKDQYTAKDCYLITLSMAAAAATKLSALLIAPLILLVMADRLSWKVTKENVHLAAKSLCLFIISFALLSQLNVKAVLGQMTKTQTSFDSDPEVYKSFLNGIVQANYPLVILITLLVGLLVVWALKTRAHKKKKKKDFLYIFIMVTFTACYLSMRIKMGSGYITNYFTTISFLLPLGLLVFDRLSLPLRRTAVLTLTLVHGMLSYNVMFPDHFIGKSWNAYHVKKIKVETEGDVAVQKKLQNLLRDYDRPLHILREHKVPSPYASMKKGVIVKSTYNNLNLDKLNRPYDLVGIFKKGKTLKTEEEFQKFLRPLNDAVQQRYKKHRDSIHHIISKKMIGKVKYRIIFENDRYLYLLRK